MNNLQLIIQRDGISLCQPGPAGATEFVKAPASPQLGERLTDFCVKNGIAANTATLFVAEELLFFKNIDLPLKTPDLKEAVGYQLGLLTPFTEETMLHSFTSVRGKNAYHVSLYAVQRQLIEPYVQQLVEAGYKIAGLYPESQRYVNKSSPKTKWALVMPGRFTRAMVFAGSRLEDQLLCKSPPAFAELAAICGTDAIYHTAAAAENGFLDAQQLARQKPLLKEHDMLPAVFQRRDFSRFLLIALLVVNLIALAGLAGVKEYRLVTLNRQIDQEIRQIMPQVDEVRNLRAREKQLDEDIQRLEGIGRNPDLITFIMKLTQELPKSSYLDQIRLDEKTGAMELQGYTEDIGELTAKLQAMGGAQLKSTSRRRNKTYFIVEISLP